MGSNNNPDLLMPQVGSTVSHLEKGDFCVLKVLASGPFSDVFEVLHLESNRKYAMKVEKEQGTIRPVLKLDVYVLSQINKNPKNIGFPKLICAGRTGYYKFAIMDLVGCDLGKLRRAMPEERFTLGTAVRVALQTLDRIQNLHELGWLCRDVKANNFAIGKRQNRTTVFMLDFGFARRYRDLQGHPLPPRSAAALLGTIHYAPMASHYNQEQCRRDDLESWLYMIVEMTGGPLPWANLQPLTQHKIIGEAKKFIRVGGRINFFEKCPPGYDEIMDIIDHTRPNYMKISSILERIIDTFGVDKNAPLDWQRDNGDLLQKAFFVEDVEKSHMVSKKTKDNFDFNEKLQSPSPDELEDSASTVTKQDLELTQKPERSSSKQIDSLTNYVRKSSK